MIKEGLSYADDKYYLDSLGVSPKTVSAVAGVDRQLCLDI
jgi:hypothetical protein